MTPSGATSDPLHVAIDSGGTGGGAITVANGADVAEGATTDAESSSGNGSVIAILKRLRTLLNGGLPAALSSNGGLKVENVAGVPALAAGAPTTQTAVAATTTSAALLASNGSATFRQIVTDAAVTIKLGTGTVTDYNGILMPANSAWDGYISGRFYTGALAVKTLTGTANVSVVEG